MVLLLCVSVGIVFFDRNAINYLMPYIAPEMGVSNTQIGLLASGLSLAWAISGLGLAALIDRTGQRRRWLVGLMVVFSLCSVVSGLAAGFVALLAARVVMGLAEGPIVPVAQSIVALESSPLRRGLNMGIVQNLGGGLLGQFVAPIVVVGLAQTYGWRVAFYVAGIPGLLLALLCLLGLREPSRRERGAVGKERRKYSIVQLLRVRNIWLCCVVSCLMLSWLVLGWVFMPLYMIRVAQITESGMSLLLAVMGLSGALCGAFVASSLSDRYGRKPVMVLFCLIGVLSPAGLLLHGGDLPVTAFMLFLGASAAGTFPVFMAAIPSESLPLRYLGTSMALVSAVGEIVGGVCAPLFAGRGADLYGLTFPLYMQVGLAILASVVSLFLLETAPRIVGSANLEHEIVI
ncbi:MFS transporter [Pseudoduganella dura]|nr:MFS transporter [Pseudoduganella dura]GGX95678.1 MFS transporter [Pseudoduganella dura]